MISRNSSGSPRRRAPPRTPGVESGLQHAFSTNSIAPTPLMSEEIPVAPASPPVPQSPLATAEVHVDSAQSPQKGPGESGEESEVRIPEPGKVFQPSPRFLLQQLKQ